MRIFFDQLAVFWCSKQTVLILHQYMLTLHKRITNEFTTIQILMVHIYSGDLTVFIGGIIINPLARITAGAVDGDLILSVFQMDAAPLLCH